MGLLRVKNQSGSAAIDPKRVPDHRSGDSETGRSRQLLPLIEDIGRYKAATAGEGVAEHQRHDDRFGPRVDRLSLFRRVFRPMRDQAPFQQVQSALASLRVSADDHGLLGWRDVPTRGDVRDLPQHLHETSDGFRGRETRVAATHGVSLPPCPGLQ